jgi:hypothetical protein
MGKVTLVLLIYCFIRLFTPSSAGAQYQIIYTQETVTEVGEIAQEPIDFGVKVSAVVPYEWWLELRGWTSPSAQVELNMEQIVKKVTTANNQGEFVFRVALPRTIAPFCLITTDVAGISSHPLCIAPPPPEFNILIEEVVMPPTLKIDKGKLAQGETAAAEGYTTPDSEVTPFLFEEESWPRIRLPLIERLTSYFITPAYAVEVPKFTIKSNQNGFFQFNLPSEAIGKNRLFVGSSFLNNPSPKSTTLVFNVLSWWKMILEKLISYLLSLFSLLLRLLTTPEGVILLEITIISAIIFFLLFREEKKKEVRG